MARHGNYKELQFKFRQQRKHSRSLNDLYGKNIWTGYEPEKDENYWNFRVSFKLFKRFWILVYACIIHFRVSYPMCCRIIALGKDIFELFCEFVKYNVQFRLDTQ